jgi:hypothetical protein
MERPTALDGPPSDARNKLLRVWANLIYSRSSSSWSNQDKLDLKERCTHVLNGIEAD